MPSVGPPPSTPPPGSQQPRRPAPPPAPATGSRWPLIVIASTALLGLLATTALADGRSEITEYTEIRAVVSDALISDDPAVCEQAMTERWLERNFESDSQEPLDRCRESITEDPARRADSAEVSALALDGEAARVTVQASGGNFGEGALDLELVADDGWKLDELTGLETDPDDYFGAQRDSLDASGPPEYARPLLECMIDWAEQNVGADEIERALLAGNEDFYAGAHDACDREFRAMMFSPVTIGAKNGYSPEQLLCISRVANATASERDVQDAFEALAMKESAPASFDAVTDEATTRCA